MKKKSLGFILALIVNLISLIFFYKSDLISNNKTSYATLLWIISVIILGITIIYSKNKRLNDTNIKNEILTLKEKIFIFLILTSGFFLRLYKIDFKGLYLDEWYWLTQAKGVLEGIVTSPFGYIGDQPSNFPAYFNAFFLAIFNNSFIAVRLPGVIYSIFNYIFVFLFLKEAFNKKVALIGLILLSTSIWDIHMSQFGWNNVTLNPFLISGTIYFFYRGFKRYSMRNIFIGSIFLGVSINLLYIAALNVFVISVYFLYQFIINHKKKDVLFLIFTAILTIFVVSSPTLIKVYKYKDATIGRHSEFLNENIKYSNKNFNYFIEQLKLAFNDFKPQINKYKVQNLWSITLDPVVYSFLIFGLIIVLGEFYKPEFFIIILNFIIMFFPVVILYRFTSIWREYGFLPSIYIISSIGIYNLIEIIRKIKFLSFFKKKAIYILFLIVYLYKENILTLPDDVYENYCKKTADYINLNVPKNTLILLPNEMCNQLLSITLLNKYQYATYDSYDDIRNYLVKNRSIILVKININYFSNQFNKESSLDVFRSVINSIKNNYQLNIIKDNNGNIFSIIYTFN